MNRIIGRMRLDLISPGGGIAARRRATNSVMQGGAELIADLFRGSAATPVNGMAVGTSSEPPAPPFTTSALTTTHGDGTLALDRFAVPLAANAMSVEVLPDLFKVRVRVRAVIPADAANSPDPQVASVEIGEAALGVLAADGLSLARLYNRVVFEPVAKTRDQELTLYWDIDFPFGGG
jgi:hypothetical protein